MTDQVEPGDLDYEYDDGDTGEPLGPVDPLLQSTIDLTNEDFWSVTLTLLVGGMLISGVTVSGDDYNRHEDELLANNATVRLPDRITIDEEATQRVRAILRERMETNSIPSGKNRARFIHLRDVRVISSGSEINLSSANWWRIRLDKVEGWKTGA